MQTQQIAFSNTNENQRGKLNAPQPGPGQGDRDFEGPVINSIELQERRDRLARLDQNRNFAPQGAPVRNPLDTRGQFRVADRAPTVEPKQSPFGLPDDRRPVAQNGNRLLQNANPPANNQGNQETYAQQQLRLAQQKLAVAEAEKRQLQQNANNLIQHAELLNQQKSDLTRQLRTADGRGFATDPVNGQSVGFQGRYPNDGTLIGQTVDAAKGAC